MMADVKFVCMVVLYEQPKTQNKYTPLKKYLYMYAVNFPSNERLSMVKMIWQFGAFQLPPAGYIHTIHGMHAVEENVSFLFSLFIFFLLANQDLIR